jgi:hypothetical protein
MMMSVPLARIAPVKRWLMTFAACGALAAPCVAQDITIPTDSATAPRDPPHYWRSVGAGFAASLLAHESAHVLTTLALGGQPSVGFNKGRPTVYSGFDVTNQRTRQFLFSSMGLNVQALLDEGILDVPHSRGSSFERGILAGGIGTALFYITIGRTASVSDVDFMARTSTLNKTDITLIYGGIAALHAFRISRDGRYANFFLRPNHLGASGLLVGVDIRPQ